MLRLREMASGVSLLIAVAMLTGCASATSETVTSPLTGPQRASIRSTILDSKWSQVAVEYPEAIRPEVTMAPTVPDHDWATAMVLCLKADGIVAYISNGVPIYGSAGQTPLEVAVSFYFCEAGHPTESQVASYFTPTQSTALYDYYLRVVRPCLLAAGAPSPASPDRSAAAGLAGLAGWNPYQVIWASGISAQTQTYLERRCPPTPTWLNLEP